MTPLFTQDLRHELHRQDRKNLGLVFASPAVDNSKCKVQNGAAPVCKESRVRDFKNNMAFVIINQHRYSPSKQVTREAEREAGDPSRALAAVPVSVCETHGICM